MSFRNKYTKISLSTDDFEGLIILQVDIVTLLHQHLGLIRSNVPSLKFLNTSMLDVHDTVCFQVSHGKNAF